MSPPPNDDRKKPPVAEWPLKTPAPAPSKPLEKGKVVHDDRGNAKWDLGLDTSRVQQLSTSQVLKELDLSNLSLLDEEDAKAKAGPAHPGGGFDPYEKARTPGAPGQAWKDPAQYKPASGRQPSPTPAPSRPTVKGPDKPRR